MLFTVLKLNFLWIENFNYRLLIQFWNLVLTRKECEFCHQLRKYRTGQREWCIGCSETRECRVSLYRLLKIAICLEVFMYYLSFWIILKFKECVIVKHRRPVKTSTGSNCYDDDIILLLAGTLDSTSIKLFNVNWGLAIIQYIIDVK